MLALMKPFKILVLVLALQFMLPMVIAGSAPSAGNSKPVIRLAYSRVIDDLPFFVGIEEGFFEQEGVQVELTRLTGATTTMAAVFRDDIQAAVIGLSQVYPAAQQGLPIKVAAWLGRTHSKTHCGLHVRKDAPIHSLKDLRGKRIAVSGEISNRMMVAEALAKGGMTDRDATVILGIELNEPMQHEAILKTGRVDVTIA
jgi:ABC-type nitrate/sulfonate/bicarbonate transport system substrate-binding protein